MTFSIVAVDPATGAAGVAVASKFLAVGAVVPTVLEGVGAIASQSDVNPAYGTDGIVLLHGGASPEEALDAVRATDEGSALRQVGIVAADGRSVSFTGTGCWDWAGGVAGDGFAIQGNLLTGPEVVADMERVWHASAARPFAERLVAALVAGDAAGGDRRGRQSASVIVAQAGAGLAGSDVAVDLRVDDHHDPVAELERIYAIHDYYFGTTPEAEWLPLDAARVATMSAQLVALGYDGASADGFDRAFEAGLFTWVGTANLEGRWHGGDRIDPVVAAALERAAAEVAG